ncbi:hypothetical protein [Desulfovulcanus sp.]
MSENNTKSSCSLSGDALEVEDVLAGAEEWSSGETWLVLGSFAAALVALIVGLMIVPSSVFH